MNDASGEAGRSNARLGGFVLICLGILIAALSGLCTLSYGISEVRAPPRLPSGAVNLFTGPAMLIFAIPFGLGPFLFGVFLALAGRDLLRRSSRGAALRHFIAGLLMTIGGLLCAADLFWLGLGLLGSGLRSDMIPIFINGLIPVVIGAGIFVAGYALYRDEAW